MAKQFNPWRFFAKLRFGTRLALGFGVGLIAVLSISLLTAAAFNFSARQQLALQEQSRKLDFATELAKTATEIQLAAVRFVSLGHESAKERALELLKAWAPRLDACEIQQCLEAARIRTVQDQFAQFSETFELVATSRSSISKAMSEDFSSIQMPVIPDSEAKLGDGSPTDMAVLHANSVNDHIAAIEAQLHAYFVSSDFRRVEAAKSHFEELKSHQSLASLEQDQTGGGQDKLKPADINVQRIERIVNSNIQRIRSYSYLTNVVMASAASELEYVAAEVAREVNAEIVTLRASIEHSRASFYRWLFAANIAILLVTIPIFLWVFHSVASPLRHLADVFRRLAGGSEEVIIKNVESRDEISDLYDAAQRFREENINARRMLEDYRILSQTLENQVAERTLELKHKNEKLDRLASLDDLTNTHNRRSLDRSLKKELTRATRYERALSVLILDIDHFKSVNDKHGHFVGDRVLVALSDCVRANIRSSDTFGRWGGEEFLLICPESDSEKALVIAEKVRTAVEESDFSIPEAVTISIGVAVFADEDTPESITSRADKALYRAKATGRNRVCIAPPSASSHSLCEMTPRDYN